jgi:exosortase
VLALVWRGRHELKLPSRPALAASGALAIAAALAQIFVPPIFAAAIAMLSLALLLASALPQRPAAPLATLLLLALPVIASLQFYLGYPLRALTAHAAAPLLRAFGIDAHAAGASLQWNDLTVLVDPPCAGIGMLWVSSFVAALLSYLNGARARRTLANGFVAAALVLAANVLRNAVLFFPEAGLVHWPVAAHRAVGLAAFALAIAPLVVFTHRNSKSSSSPLSRPSPADGRGGLRVGTVKLVPYGRLRNFFVGACLAAAVLSVFASIVARRAARAVEANAAVATRTSSVEWPTHFRGRPLTQLAPAPLDARFAHRFPGAIARFSDGTQTLIVRRVDQPTRTLHPATDCFRAAGYSTTVSSAQLDETGEHWRCFVAARNGARVRVCERIVAGRFGAHEGYTDVSAWYWSALASTGPWWAITVISALDGAAT